MKMLYVYAAGILAASVATAGVIGARAGAAKCHAQHARDAAAAYAQMIKIQGNIHEKVLRTATDDIRRILREKYTIAD